MRRGGPPFFPPWLVFHALNMRYSGVDHSALVVAGPVNQLDHAFVIDSRSRWALKNLHGYRPRYKFVCSFIDGTGEPLLSSTRAHTTSFSSRSSVGDEGTRGLKDPARCDRDDARNVASTAPLSATGTETPVRSKPTAR